MAESKYELNTLTNLQKYINTQGLGESEATVLLGNVYNTLDKLNTSVLGSGLTLNGVLNHQQEMKDILDNERNRVEQKKGTIDNAYTGKMRAVTLNESYRLRYNHIFKIILVIIVTLILFVLITYMSKAYPFIPSSVFEILTIFVISVGIFSVYFLTINMIKRSKVYFDQLAIPSPLKGNTVGISEQKGKNKSLQDLLAETDLNFCIGSDCCAYGTVWDAGNASCMGNSSLMRGGAFTTISESYNLGEFSGKLPIQSNSPNEFSEYTLVK
jgi:hypothetical protein